MARIKSGFANGRPFREWPVVVGARSGIYRLYMRKSCADMTFPPSELRYDDLLFVFDHGKMPLSVSACLPAGCSSDDRFDFLPFVRAAISTTLCKRG